MNHTGNKKSIKHDGTVLEVGLDTVTVCISSAAACVGCMVEGSCSLSDKEEKIIKVTGRYNVKPGDRVTILMDQSMGYSALFLGYLLPLVIVIVSLIIAVSSGISELRAGLISIGTLCPYYLILFIFRKRINKKFTFSLKQ